MGGPRGHCCLVSTHCTPRHERTSPSHQRPGPSLMVGNPQKSEMSRGGWGNSLNIIPVEGGRKKVCIWVEFPLCCEDRAPGSLWPGDSWLPEEGANPWGVEAGPCGPSQGQSRRWFQKHKWKFQNYAQQLKIPSSTNFVLGTVARRLHSHHFI